MNDAEVAGKKIENGSYVLVKSDEHQVNNNDVFLFVVNGGATIKKYKQTQDNIFLLPQSRDDFHKPIILSVEDDIAVNGKVVDVFHFE